jgi:hypothetical protein
MIGRFTRRMFRLAQRVKVRVTRVRETRRRMDLELVSGAVVQGTKQSKKTPAGVGGE